MLNIKDLTVVFNEGTVNEKKAIDHLSLHLEPGDFVTIIGSNGAGKSTLFGAISGAVETKEGTIILDDKDITNEKEYVRSRTIGRLFQDPLRGTAPSMTIEENLSLAYQRGKHFSLTPFTHKHHDVFVNALKDLDIGLEDRLTTKVGTLSGGQRQRLVLARALLKDSSIYIMDEATSNIDVESENKIMEVLYELSKEKLVLCISHRLANLIHADAIYCLKDGDIVESGTHEELLQQNGVYRDLFNTQKELERYGA